MLQTRLHAKAEEIRAHSVSTNRGSRRPTLTACPTRVLRGIHVLGRRWTESVNLNDNSFVIGLGEMIPRGWFRVEAAGGRALSFASSNLSPYPRCHVPETTVATLSSRWECAAMRVCAGT